MIYGLLRSLSNGWKTIPPERHVQFGPQPPPARLYVTSAVMRDRKEAIQANNHNLGPRASTSTAAASAVMRDERKPLAQYATSSLGRPPPPFQRKCSTPLRSLIRGARAPSAPGASRRRPGADRTVDQAAAGQCRRVRPSLEARPATSLQSRPQPAAGRHQSWEPR